MQKILDLKKLRHQKEEESQTKKLETTEFLPLTVEQSPQPIQISWGGPLSDRLPNLKAVGIFSVVLFGIGVLFIFFQKNFFAGGFFVLAGLFLLIIARKPPRETEFVLGPLSVKVGPHEHNFKEIKSFWIDYQPQGNKELSLQLKKWYMPYVKIPLYQQNPLQLRLLLLKFVPEIEHEDNLLTAIERILGF